MEYIIECNRLDNSLYPDIVLVQSKGMAKWVKISLEERFGIETNIQFLFPREFIWNLFVQTLPDIPKKSAFSKQSINWKLMTLLPEILDQKAFLDLRDYLNGDIEKRKLLKFVSYMADLYDRYLVYRPFWLNSWESNQLIKGLPKMQVWQALLWKSIIELTKKLNQPKWHDANLYSRFIATMESTINPLIMLPSRIFICGIFTMPPTYLDILRVLGKYIDIHILFTNPCRYYWGSIPDTRYLDYLTTYPQSALSLERVAKPFFNDRKKTAQTTTDTKKEISLIHQNLSNPLLSSWGKIGRDYMYELYALSSSEKRNVNAFLEANTNSMLHNIQMDILNLENKAISSDTTTSQYTYANAKRCLDLNDYSLTVHVCHSPLHEVEVLHDWLTSILQDDCNLTPRDIVVMVSNIEHYSPFIQGVFNSVEKDLRIPYSISDYQIRLHHSIIQAFIKLLSLFDSRFFSEDVIALLGVSSIAARFNIKESDLYYIRKWVKESGIRWGLNNDNVKEFNFPVTGQHTWTFGLTRILLGSVMESSQRKCKKVLPNDESNRLIVELTRNLGLLITKLTYLRREFKKARTLQSWMPFYKKILDNFFLLDSEEEAAMAIVEKQWKNLIIEGLSSNYSKPISFSFLQNELIRRLNQEDDNHCFLTKSVNVCKFIPMRNIPFKVICLLGMNEDVYPRKFQPLNLNLMNYQKKRGDRNQHDDDRYLFLETLISAQKIFYVSYIDGSFQKQGKNRSPSTLVQELLDYIGKSYYLPGEKIHNYEESEDRVKNHIVFHHSRTILNRKTNHIFKENKKQQHHSHEWIPSKKRERKVKTNFIQMLNPLDIKQLEFHQLQYFWSHPVRAFFQKRLKINSSYEEMITSNVEPFMLDKLDRYRLNQKLLNAFLEKQDVQVLYQQYRMAGKLPYGFFGKIIWEKQCQEMKALAERITKYRQSSQNMEINFDCNGVQLTGWLQCIQQNGLLRWCTTTLSVSQCLQFWLEHLVFNANGYEKESRLLARKGGERCFSPITSKVAKDYLSLFVEGYLRGMNKPLLLLPEIGGALVEAFYWKSNKNLLTNEILFQKAQRKFFKIYNGDTVAHREGRDIWYQRLWNSPEPKYFKIFIEEAKRYLLPMYKFIQS